MLKFWCRVAEELEDCRKVFVALVVGHQKGSPGTARAQLLYTESGEQWGTIGGGAMEANLLKAAETALREGPDAPILETLFHRNTGNETASGLICGGAQTQVTMVLGEADLSMVHAVLDRLQNDRSGTLEITSKGLSLFEEDLEQPSIRVSGQNDDWRVRLGLLNRRRILIVGCGHCGASLAKQMDLMGFHVTVAEPRLGIFTMEGLPAEVFHVSRPFSEVSDGIEHARLTYAVVMTPSYPDDVDALTSLISKSFPYVGVMGSSAKLEKIHKTLLDRGFSESDWLRLYAPVGLPLDSDTPEEIAVSIAAQILQLSKQT